MKFYSEQLCWTVFGLALVISAAVLIHGCQDYLVRDTKESQILIEKCGRACRSGMHKFSGGPAACECK